MCKVCDHTIHGAQAHFGWDNSLAPALDVVKGQCLKTPRFTTPGPVTRLLDAKGYEATTGVGPDLMTAAKDAVSGMIDLLTAQQGISAVDAYMLCSVRTEAGVTPLVLDLGFTLNRGENLAIAGESGSGKSITALAIMGLLPPPAVRVTGGKVTLSGLDLTALPEAQAGLRAEPGRAARHR